MRNISDTSCRSNQTHILCSLTFSENHVFYEIMWENMVDADRPQVIIQCCTQDMRFACR